MKKSIKLSVSLFLLLMFTFTMIVPAFADTSYYTMHIQSENGAISMISTGEKVDGEYKFPAGTVVKLNPVADSGYVFSYWLIDGSKYYFKTAIISADANDNFTVEAFFSQLPVNPVTAEPTPTPTPATPEPAPVPETTAETSAPVPETTVETPAPAPETTAETPTPVPETTAETPASASIPNQYTFHAELIGNGAGIISTFNSSYIESSEIAITATPDTNSIFSGWYIGDTLVSSELSYSFTIEDNTVLQAKFEKKQYALEIAVIGNGTGIISTYNPYYNASSVVTLTATPNKNSYFCGWYIGDTLISSELSYSFTIEDNTVLQAKFEIKQYALKIAVIGNGTGIISTYNPYYNASSVVTLTATPDASSHFIGWYIGDTLMSYYPDYSFIINEDTLLQAKYELKFKDVTSKMQLLGNPFTLSAYARNVWDMQVFNGSIYLGHGNSSNYAPAANAGPIDVVRLDTASDTFSKEYTVNEEQIDVFKIINDNLYIPGHDSKESWTYGNYYTLMNNTWNKVQSIPNGIHVYDMASYNSNLYAALGTNIAYPLASSSDNGNTWSSVVPSTTFYTINCRANSMFEFKGKLYVTGMFKSASSRYNDMICVSGNTASVVKVAGSLMMPDVGTTDYVKLVKPTVVNDNLLYIAGKIDNDHQHIPLALYISTEIGNAKKVTFSESTAVPYDILVRGSTVYVLASAETSDGIFKNIVYKSTDMNRWEEVFHFNSDTFARSFEEISGDFYFGLGCDTTNLTESTGNILKVDKSIY